MKLKIALSLLILCCHYTVFSQIKIGDNPQNIDAASLLELESTERAFVITRVTTAQMNTITPIEGAMVYNTEIQCLHYYDGTEWLNLCESLGLTITNNPIVHGDTTIAITRVDRNINIEVDSITGLQIVDRSIRGDDIAGSAINGNFHIQNRSVPAIKLIPSPIPNQILKTNAAATDAVWATPPPPVIALGKLNGATVLKIFGAVIGGSGGIYTVNLTIPRLDDNYNIQLTVGGDNRIFVINQTPASFTIEIRDNALGNLVGNTDWYFAVFDN
jgi:hypothetical protein